MTAETSLESIINGKIAERGYISYREFLRTVHQHPEFGYYSSGVAKVSPDGGIQTGTGDFSTHPEKYSPAYGAGIALMLNRIAETNGGIGGIVELGAGNGTLARDTLDALKTLNPSLYDSLTYRIVELSPVHVENQRATLKWHLDKVDIRHGDVAKSTLPIMDGNYVVISNELFDDLPVTKTVVKNEQLCEVYVSADESGKLVEVLGEVSDPIAVTYFNKMKSAGRTYSDGEVVMIHSEGVKLMSDINNALQKGLVITIDYGSFDTKPDPSDRTYSRLVMPDDQYKHIGKQNITHDVDFWSLAHSQPNLTVEHVGPDLTTVLKSADINSVARLMDLGDWAKLSIGSERSKDSSFLMMIQSKGDFKIPEDLRDTFDGVSREYRENSMFTSYRLEPDRIIRHLNAVGNSYLLTSLGSSEETSTASIQVDSNPNAGTGVGRITFGVRHNGLGWKITGMGWEDGNYHLGIYGDTPTVDIRKEGERAGKPLPDLTPQGKEVIDRLKTDTPLGIALQKLPVPERYSLGGGMPFYKKDNPSNVLYVVK